VKKYSLSEIKLAEELAFPADMKQLLQKHDPEFGFLFYSDFMHRHGRSLIAMIFAHSRHDFETTNIGKLFESIIDELLRVKRTAS
jgi:hypothetical protein